MTIAEIEDAVLSRLQNAGLGVRLEIQKGSAGIPQPAVHLSTDMGRFEKVSQNTTKWIVVLSLDVVFKNFRTEKDRRRGLYPILHGIVSYLSQQTLSLAIAPLAPKTFRNVTTEEDAAAGEIVYLLEFETSFNVTRMEDEQAVDLITVGLSYLNQPGDQVADASDTVTLSQ